MGSATGGAATDDVAGRGPHGVGNWIACCLSRGRAAPLNRRDIDDLATEMGERKIAGGTFVFREGDRAARVHVVRTGSVDLSKVVGGRRETLQRLRPGDVFGDVPALLGRSEPFDARAVEDSTVLSFEAATLFALLETRPGVARRWFVSMAEARPLTVARPGRRRLPRCSEPWDGRSSVTVS